MISINRSIFNQKSFIPISENQTLQNLIESLPNINHQDALKKLSINTFSIPLANGEIPLHYAIRKKSTVIVEWILTHTPVDLKQKDRQGLTPVDHAFIDSNLSIQKIVFNHCFKEQTTDIKFQQTISHKQYQSIRSNIEGEVGKHNVTFNLEELKFFPKEYLNRNISVHRGDFSTYLMSAIVDNNQPAIDFLLDVYEKPADLAGLKTSPIHVAAFTGNLKALELLIAKGANVNAKDSFGYTPLHYAVPNHNFDVIKMLSKHGADFSEGASSPLAFMVAHAKHSDPLRYNNRELITFCFSIAAAVTSYYVTDPQALQNMFGMKFMAMSLISWVVGIWQGDFMDRGWILTNIGLSFVIAVEKIQTPVLFFNAIVTSSVALKKLAACWKNRHLDATRSIKSAILQSINTLVPIFEFYQVYYANALLGSSSNQKIAKRPVISFDQKVDACNRVWDSGSEIRKFISPTNLEQKDWWMAGCISGMLELTKMNTAT